MVSKAQIEAQKRYDEANTVQFHLKLNRKTDADIIERLQWAADGEGKQGYIKRLIRQDIDRNYAGRKENNMTAKQIIDAGLFEAAVVLMDDEIREEVHADLSPCTEEEFLEEYMKRHEARYGIGFVVQ